MIKLSVSLLALLAGVAAAAPPSDYEVDTVDIPRSQPAIAVRIEVAADELGARMPKVIARLLVYATRNNAELAGPPFVRYHARDASRLDVEIGLPVVKAIDGEGDILAVELPAGPAIATVHRGAYERLPRAHAALARWAEARDRTAAGPGWEVFLTDPHAYKKPSQWRTKVFLPLSPK